jgi:competence protein ComEC
MGSTSVLLAVSGQNVALVAGSVLLLVWLIGLPRLFGQLAALAAICAYVLAVGAQPSVIRAGVAGALGSLAWLTARAADRWHLLFVGAIVLLAWNPYTLLDAGFQFSFAAVLAIFVLVPRFERFLEGYPLGRSLRLVVAISAACGSCLLLQSISLKSVGGKPFQGQNGRAALERPRPGQEVLAPCQRHLCG